MEEKDKKDKERLEELFPILPGTHTDIPYDQMKWLLERNFLPLNRLWQWHGPDIEGKPYHVMNHGHGKYNDGTEEIGQGWWSNRFNDPGDPNGGQVTGRFFRTPWEALADVVSGNGRDKDSDKEDGE